MKWQERKELMVIMEERIMVNCQKEIKFSFWDNPYLDRGIDQNFDYNGTFLSKSFHNSTFLFSYLVIPHNNKEINLFQNKLKSNSLRYQI